MRYEDTVSYSDDINVCESCGVRFEGHPGSCDECAEPEEEEMTVAEITASILALTYEVAEILRGARERMESYA